MTTTPVATAGINLLAGSAFELNWVIRGTEWSQGSIPSGWQAVSTPIASGSGHSGQAAAEMVAIQRQISTQANQAYALRMQFPGALPQGAELLVEWGGETIAQLSSADVTRAQGITLMLNGSSSSQWLRLITNRSVALGAVSGLGLWAQPNGGNTPLPLPSSAKVGQTLVANTSSIGDVDGLGEFSYQWQRKDNTTQQWVDIQNAATKSLVLSSALAGEQLRVEVSYIDGDGTQEVLVSQATASINHANRAPSAGSTKQLPVGQEDQSVLISTADLLRGSSDADGDALSIKNLRLKTGQGTLSRVNESTWSFKPVANWFGDVELTYQISDGKAVATASARLQVSAVNDAPTASTVVLQSIEEDSSGTFTAATLLEGANDVDGDALRVENLHVLEGEGQLHANTDGSWSFEPTHNWNGGVRLGYSVSDGKGGSVAVQATLQVEGVNDAPELTEPLAGLADGREDRIFTIQEADLLQGFTDPDGDKLQVLNLRVSEGNGTLQAGDNGTWFFIPQDDWTGRVQLDYQVSDGKLLWRSPGVPGEEVFIDGTSFETTLWRYTGQGGVFIQEVDGWNALDGESIEVKNNADGGGSASDGAQFIELNKDPLGYFPDASGIFKNIETQADQGYVLSLQYAGRAGYDEEVNRFEVLINGTSQGIWSQTNTSGTAGDSSLGGDHDWQTLKIAFQATGPSTRVELREAGTDMPYGRGMRIDDIRIEGISMLVPADTVRQSFEILPGNDAPELTGAPSALVDGKEDHAYTIQISDLLQGYTDKDGDILSVDGLSSSVGSLSNNNDGTWTLTPPRDFNGPVELSYSVIDGEGGSAEGSKTFQLTPVNDAPTVSQVAQLGSVDEDNSFSFSAAQLLAHASDVDGDSLSVVNLTVDPSLGSITDHGDGTFTFSPTKDFNGLVAFSYGVSDGQGSPDPYNATLSATPAGAQLTVNPVNDAPTVSQVAQLGSVDEDNSFSFSAAQLLAHASDVDGDSLSVVNLTVDPSLGSITDHGDGTFTFSPTKDFNGLVAFSYGVSDGQGSPDPYNATLSATPAGAQLTVNPVNDAPTVSQVAQLGSVDEDNSFSFSAAQLLAHASDVDGDSLSVVNLSVDPSLGSITDHGDGTFTFSPTKDFNGLVAFSYGVSDGQGSPDPYNATLSATPAGAQLTVNPVNDAPTVSQVAQLGSVDEDNSFSFSAAQLLAHASDVDGDSLSVVNLTVDPSLGSITDHGDGTFTFSPTKDFNGLVAFSYGVSDGQGSPDPYNATLSATPAGAQLTVNPVNDAPTVSQVAQLGSVDEDNSFSFSAAQLLAHASDVDGDSLSVVNLTVDPSLGSITDHGDGTFTFSPTKDFNGLVAFSYGVSDGKHATQIPPQTPPGAGPNPPSDSNQPPSDSQEAVIIPTALEINEGGTLQALIEVKGLQPGTAVFWEIEGSRVNGNDFTSGATHGNGLLDGNRRFVFQQNVKEDGFSEGIERLSIKVFADEAHTQLLGRSNEIAILDSSTMEHRSINGSGNNLAQSLINSASSTFNRIGPANYADGVHAMFAEGQQVNARKVSNEIIAGDRGQPNQEGASAMLYAWGQFIDHDITQMANSDARDPRNLINIKIPDGDPFLNGEITVTRRGIAAGTGVNAKPAEILNAVTGWLDASMVYGSDAATAARLRGPNGLMRVSDGSNLPIANNGRGLQFDAGDNRAAENPNLTALQTLFIREHNRLIGELTEQNPEWGSDELYEHARAIVGAKIAHITYNEFLPKLIGSQAIGAYEGHKNTVDSRLSVEFAGAAYRFGHSLVSSEVRRLDNDGNTIGSPLNLRDAFFMNPQLFLKDGGADAFLRNLASDSAKELDVHISDDLRNFLNVGPGMPSMDLAAINIQRGRDLGLGSLNQTRSALGLEIYTSFDEITSDRETAASLERIYGSVDNVELWVGGLAEDHAGGGMVGETFQRIIANQFRALRDGDRLWFENNLFEAETLEQIRGTKLSELIRINTDTTVIQDDVFSAVNRIDLVAHAGLRTGSNTENGNGEGAQEGLQLGNPLSTGGHTDLTATATPATAQFFINPVNDAPVVLGDADLGSAEEDSNIIIKVADLLKNAIDVDHDPLTVVDLKVTSDNGILTKISEDSFSFAPSPNFNGRITFSYGVSDGKGSRDPWTGIVSSTAAGAVLTVNPVNDAPTVSGDAALTSTDEDSSVTFTANDLLQNAIDVDGDLLSVVDLKLTSGNGTLISNSDGSFTFTPDSNVHGQATFSYGVSDGKGSRDPWTGAISATPTGASLHINPVNDIPALTGAKAVLAGGIEDLVYTIKTSDLLQGFSDVDGDALSIANLSASSGSQTVALSNAGAGTWTLTPPKDFNGTVNLTYSVIDGNGGSTAATQAFSLAPVNDAPVVSGGVNLGSMEEDGTFRIHAQQLLAKASDVDGDTLSVVDLKLSSGQGSLTTNADGSWTFSPAKDWNGPVAFSYGVTDGKSISSNRNKNQNVLIRGNSLYALTDVGTWTDTEAMAQKMGGHLVTINDANENKWITDTFYKPDVINTAWIGYRQTHPDSGYSWSSSSTSAYSNWLPGHPDWPSYELYAHIDLYNPSGNWADSNNEGWGNGGLMRGIAEIPFIQRDNSAYIVVQGPSWEQSEANALKLAGHLVTINDSSENEWIRQNFGNYISPSSGGADFWIGLTDHKHEGHWEWVDGETFDYSSFFGEVGDNGVGNGMGCYPTYDSLFTSGTWWQGNQLPFDKSIGEDFGLINAPSGHWNDLPHDHRDGSIGIAEIKLGSDFEVTGSATLQVDAVNDSPTGEPIIDVIGDAADETSPETPSLGLEHLVMPSTALTSGGTNPRSIPMDGELLAGSVWDDQIIGSDANDVLIGSIAGANGEQIDLITGGGGADLFVLGNKSESFYGAQGFKDYAQITDFDPTKDQLQLHGGSAYAIAQVQHPDVIGTGIFRDANRDGLVGGGDDLIAVISNQNQPVEIQRDNLRLV